MVELNQVWCRDVTFIWTGYHWAYLAIVIDLFAQQDFGGHGYIHEWGMELFVRDIRIAMGETKHKC